LPFGNSTPGILVKFSKSILRNIIFWKNPSVFLAANEWRNRIYVPHLIGGISLTVDNEEVFVILARFPAALPDGTRTLAS